jgi:hypothetical protein
MLYFNCTCLHINTFYFFEDPGSFNLEGLIELYLLHAVLWTMSRLYLARTTPLLHVQPTSIEP